MDKILNAIQSILVAAALTGVKDVIYGDPQSIPEGSFPAITIMPVSTEYEKRGNQYDQKVHTIRVKLIYNAKDIVGKTYAASNKPKVHKIEESVKLVEQTNATFSTTTSSIVGLIQQKPTLPNAGVATCQTSEVTGIYYGNSTDRGFPTYEVQVDVRAVQVANRKP